MSRRKTTEQRRGKKTRDSAVFYGGNDRRDSSRRDGVARGAQTGKSCSEYIAKRKHR